MANVVDFVMQITAGKSPVNIRKIADELSKLKSKLGDVQDKAKVSFKKFGESAKKAKAKVKDLSIGLAKVTAVAGGSVAAFVKMNQVIADSTNEIIDASTRSGIAAETLAGLRLAAEGSGKSFSSLERGLDQFSTRMLDTSRGTGEAKKTFDSLGISVVDAQGNLRDTNSVFMETIKKLGQMTNATKRNADINKLFGRSGMTLIQSGAIENLDEFIGKAKELGPAFDENGIEKAAEFQRGMADFKTASVGALKLILEGLTGEEGLGKSLSSLAEDMVNFSAGFGIFMEGIRNTFAGLKIFTADLGDDLAELIEQLREIDASQIQQIAGGVAAGFGGAAFAQRLNAGGTAENIVATQQAADAAGLSLFEYLDQQAAQQKQIQKQAENQSKETRKAIREGRLNQLTKKIESGEIKDFRAIQGQLFSLRGEIKKAGESVKEIDKLIASFKKLSRAGKSKGLPALPKFKFDSGSGSGKTVDEDLKKFNDAIKKGEESLRAYEKKANELNQKTLSKLDKQFLKLAENVRSGNVNFEEAGTEANILKMKFENVGLDTTNLDQLIEKINELQDASRRAQNLDFALKISADVVGLAGGDIQGFLSSIFEKTLQGQQLQTANLALGLSGAIASLGEQFVMAGDQAIDEENARREQRNIALMEKAFGRSLSEQEKQNVKNRIKLSEKEERAIREQAAKDKVAEDVERFSLAIKTGLQVLPSILFEVLPPLFLQLAQDIVQAIIELPFRIGAAILDGIKSLFTAIVEGPKRFFEGIGSFLSGLFDGKRTGGRFVSARRGMRFTGAQDGLAMLHRNEYVVPESGARPQAVERIMNQQNGGGMVININADVVDRDAVETLVRKIEQRFQSFGQFQSTLFAG